MSRILLTTISLLFVSQSLSAQEQGGIIYNARSLTDREWAYCFTSRQKDYNSQPIRYTSSKKYDKKTGKTIDCQSPVYPTYKMTSSIILSLKPKNSWEAGSSWVMKVTQNRNNKNQVTLEAWSGIYDFYADGNNKENLILNLACTKKYIGRKTRNEISWRLDTSYEKKGSEN